MKKFCESLREHAKEIINSKKMKSLTIKQHKSDKNAKKNVIIKEKTLNINMLKIKNNVKLGKITYIKVNMEVLHIAYVI